tara:strand:- start:428 stop:655 length:228 start_codon:yes stop_codon:yes gene_type:complete
MTQFIAIKIFREGKWEDASRNNKAKGTIVMVNHLAISSIIEVQLLNGDPACTLAMTDGTQIMVNVDAVAAFEALI